MKVRQDLLMKLGWSTHWNHKNRDEVTRYHRKLWENFKKDNGYAKNTSVENFPGFLESIEQLSLYGYSFTDIGSVFGLSRERVRQYFEKHELKINESNRAMFRLWDDEKNCFIALSRKDLSERLVISKRERKEKKHEGEKESQIKAIQTFSERYGRPPFITELMGNLGLNQLQIAKFWGYRKDGEISVPEAIDTLYIAAGCRERKKVGRGSGWRKLESLVK